MATAKRFFRNVSVSALVLYVGIAIASWRFYPRILYPAPQGRTSLPPNIGELRTVVASDGVPVHALEFPAPAGGMTVAHFHGNGETIADNVNLALDLTKRGFGVMLVEYRGYGVSAGVAPTEEGLYRDAEAALDMLTQEGVGTERVILWGTSLGSGVAVEMAQRRRGAALVLLSPYTSIPDLAQRTAPFLPVHFIIRDRFDTLAKAPRIAVPTLVVHGDEDETIPVAMGRAVSASIPGARILIVQGGHHNDLLLVDHSGLMNAVAALASNTRR